MTRDITAQAQLVGLFVDISCGSGKKQKRINREKIGLFAVHVGPIYDQNRSFSYTSYRNNFDTKKHFAPRFFRIGKQNLAWSFLVAT